MSTLRLHIAHLSDTHSRIEPHIKKLGALDGLEVRFGGYPLIISALKHLRHNAITRGIPFLALHAGDSFQGSRHFEAYPGSINADMLNLMSLNAMAIGNHEFDKGPACFSNFCHNVNFPILAGNLFIGDQADADLHNCLNSGKLITANHNHTTAIQTMPDGSPIAIIGITLEELPDLAETGPDVTAKNAISYAKNEVNSLNESGIKRIIAVSHLGLDRDYELAAEIPNLTAILGGHTHTLMGQNSNLGFDKCDYHSNKVGDVLILHCGENGSHVGVYSLLVDNTGCVVDQHCESVAPLDITRITQQQIAKLDNFNDILLVEPDADALELLHKKFALDTTNEHAPVLLNRPLRHVRVPEPGKNGELAQLIVDSIFQQVSDLGHDVDLAILNAGVLRKGLDAGKYEDLGALISEVVPFDLEMIMFTISGKSLSQTLCRAREQSKIISRSGRYPYLAPSNPSFEENKMYNVVTTSYIASGKDGYTEFSEKGLEKITTLRNLREICLNCIYDLSTYDEAKQLIS